MSKGVRLEGPLACRIAAEPPVCRHHKGAYQQHAGRPGEPTNSEAFVTRQSMRKEKDSCYYCRRAHKKPPIFVQELRPPPAPERGEGRRHWNSGADHCGNQRIEGKRCPDRCVAHGPQANVQDNRPPEPRSAAFRRPADRRVGARA